MWARLMKLLNKFFDKVDRGDFDIGETEDGYEHYG